MTYALAWDLQRALFDALRTDPAVAALTGARVWDEPAGAPSADGAPWLTIGDETVEPWSTATDDGAAHVLTIVAAAERPGFEAVKRLAAAACEVALGPLPLARGRVVGARLLGARTRREDGGRVRLVELRVRIVVEDAA
jgi:hypothetical protein